MQTRVLPAERSEVETLRNLFQLYAHDFSEVLPLDVDEAGRFSEPQLAAYWVDAWRVPYVLRVDDRLGGFALVHRTTGVTQEGEVWDMAEFFVLRRYRRAGVGTAAAHQIFAMHPGEWEVRQLAANVAAAAFWRRAIARYTDGRFHEERLDDKRWRGPVQRFTSGPAAPSP
jgi:predicted acetyltransferase